DFHVTGVQTCALPIWCSGDGTVAPWWERPWPRLHPTGAASRPWPLPRARPSGLWRFPGGPGFGRHLRPRGLRAHLLDRVPQLAAQDHLGVARPGVQAVVEDQLAVAVQPHQFQLAQLLDEARSEEQTSELQS